MSLVPFISSSVPLFTPFNAATNWENTHSCVTNVAGGAVATMITRIPWPLLLGISDCFTKVAANHTIQAGYIPNCEATQNGRKAACIVPKNAFNDTLGHALSYSATQIDGSKLPDTLIFDAASRTFTGRVYKPATYIRVTVIDSVNITAYSDFEIISNPLYSIILIITIIAVACGLSVCLVGCGYVASHKIRKRCEEKDVLVLHDIEMTPLITCGSG